MTTCFGKELFIRFTVQVFLERLPVCVCASFPLGFEGVMWDFIVLMPDQYLSIYFSLPPLTFSNFAITDHHQS